MRQFQIYASSPCNGPEKSDPFRYRPTEKSGIKVARNWRESGVKVASKILQMLPRKLHLRLYLKITLPRNTISTSNLTLRITLLLKLSLKVDGPGNFYTEVYDAVFYLGRSIG